jgi:hypothetical protein
MDATKVTDELIDAGFQALESDDSAAFTEWRRRVAAALGPDHVYTQMFEASSKNQNKRTSWTDASLPSAANKKSIAQDKRVA